MTAIIQTSQRSKHRREGAYDTSATALVRRQWRLFITIVALCMASGLGLFYVTEPEYTARIDIVVIAHREVATAPREGATAPADESSDVSMDSVAQLLLSDRVLGYVARSVPYPGGKVQLRSDIQISPVINSRIFRIYVRNSSAQVSLEAASGIAERLFEQRLQSLAEEAAAQETQLQAQLRAIDQALESASSVNPDTSNPDSAPLEESNLLSHHQEVQSQLAALSVNSPEAGYVSRPAELPQQSSRSGFSIFFGSAFAIGTVAASTVCSWRERAHIPN